MKRWLAGESIAARPTPAAERLVKWVRRKPALAGFWATAALLLLTLAVGGPLVAWQQARLRAEVTTQVIRLHVANGTRKADEGDLLESLLWYAKALELDAGDPLRGRPCKRPHADRLELP